MAHKITLLPPFFPFRKGSFFPLAKTKGPVVTEYTRVRSSGTHELRSSVSIDGASNNDYAHSWLRTTSLMDVFKAPGAGPLKIRVIYDPVVLVYNGSIEAECGFSHILFYWSLAPYAKVWYPTQQTLGRTGPVQYVRHFGPIYEVEHPPWNGIHTPKKFVAEFSYQSPNGITKGDPVWMDVGLELEHNVIVDDVSVSSLVDATASVSKVEVSATGA